MRNLVAALLWDMGEAAAEVDVVTEPFSVFSSAAALERATRVPPTASAQRRRRPSRRRRPPPRRPSATLRGSATSARNALQRRRRRLPCEVALVVGLALLAEPPLEELPPRLGVARRARRRARLLGARPLAHAGEAQ